MSGGRLAGSEAFVIAGPSCGSGAPCSRSVWARRVDEGEGRRAEEGRGRAWLDMARCDVPPRSLPKSCSRPDLDLPDDQAGHTDSEPSMGHSKGHGGLFGWPRRTRWQGGDRLGMGWSLLGRFAEVAVTRRVVRGGRPLLHLPCMPYGCRGEGRMWAASHVAGLEGSPRDGWCAVYAVGEARLSISACGSP